ncbi:MAG: hypothetical protein AAF696_22255 [Bacteroidota bacterium]
MNFKWLLISLGAGLASGLISYFLFQNVYISTFATIGVFVLVLLNNPKRFYRKAFWVLLSMIPGKP